MRTSLELMTMHVAALYTHDSAGRIVRVNEHDGGPAPRCFVGQTQGGLVCRYRDDVDSSTQRALQAATAELELPGLAAEAEANAAAHLARYAAILARTSPVEHMWAGPAFAFPQGLPPIDAMVVRVTDANMSLLDPLMSAWVSDIHCAPPLFARVVDGRAVAVCASVRITPAAHEAGVETAAAFRGRGYVLQAVAAWAQAVRAAGAEPLYSTAWQNLASRAVARKLGLIQFGSDLHIT